MDTYVKMNTFMFFTLLIACVTIATTPSRKVRITASEEIIPDYPDLGPSPGIIIGDIEVNPHRLAVSPEDLKWENGIVPYKISRLFPTVVKATIMEAIKEIEHNVNGVQKCVQFVERTTQFYYLRISPWRGCHSYVGFQHRPMQEVSIGKGCERKGVIMHELLHALGLYHEHNRPDRDDYVSIDYTNLEEGDQQDFLKMTEDNATTFGTPYDYNSIMHYGAFTWGKDPARVVVTPRIGMAKGIKTGQRLYMTPNDVKNIQHLYNCTIDVSHVTKPMGLNETCTFETDICNLANSNDTDFAWIRKKGYSASGPTAGSTNGRDYYLLAEAAGHEGSIAKLETPLYNNGSVCLDMNVFQKRTKDVKHIKSYLAISASGPEIYTQRIRNFLGYGTDTWKHHKISINVEAGVEFKVILEAHMSKGDLAIDDLFVYDGHCSL